MNCDLPESVSLGGREVPIRTDYRAILDILGALSDPELSQRSRQLAALAIFYPEPERISPENAKEALEKCFWFIGGGAEPEEGQRARRLMDWEQDFALIAPPVNRVLGREIRGDADLHWWTFLSAFYESGDCTFAQVVGIRDKLRRGKKLEKWEREYWAANKSLCELRPKLTAEEQAEKDRLNALLG